MPNRPATLTIPLSGPATLPAIAVDSEGRVVVAWSQSTGHNPSIFLRRWNHQQWESLGPSSTDRGAGGTKGEAFAPALALDPSGNPSLAWQDRSYGNHEVYYRHWDGAQWEELAGSATEGGVSRTNTGYSGFPSLALDANGAPVVAWEEHYGSKSDIWVRRYTSGRKRGWLDVGDHPGLTGFPAKVSDARFPSLALDAHGNPVVAWIDNDSGSDQVYLQRWSGKRWEELAGSASQGGVSRSRNAAASVTLKLDASGNPILSWKEGDGAQAAIQVRRWAGLQWESLGGPVADPGSNPAWPCLALDARSQPVVAFRAGAEVRLRRWTANKWETLAIFPWQNPPPNSQPIKRQMALAAGAGTACAVWIEEGAQPALRVGCVDLRG